MSPARVPDYPHHRSPRLARWGVIVSSIVFPLLALWCGLQMRQFLVAFGYTSLVTTIGGCVIAWFLSDGIYLQKISAVPGIKTALLIPLFLSPFLVYRFDELRMLWRRRIMVGHLWIAGGLITLLLVVLMRSGNYSFGFIGPEESMRRFLEDLLAVRPRTKEFLFGHPLLVLGFFLRNPLLIVLGMLGQVSIINTFMHAHTPFMVSLIRTVHGWWIGTAIGMAAVGVVVYIRHRMLHLRGHHTP